MNLKCDNCDGKGRVTYKEHGIDEECCMCNGKGTIGLGYKLIDWSMDIYYWITGHIRIIWYGLTH